jgi:hypothetical protein
VAGDILGISDNPLDNTDVDRIDTLLSEGMPRAEAGTVVIDSVTAILEPIVTRIMADIEAERIRNKAGAWRAKAMAMKMLHNLQRFGADVAMVYHEHKALNASGEWQQTRTISQLEEARMLKSLNLLLRVFRESGRYGVTVVWARNGRSGITLWDEAGYWEGMPERIEAAVYDNLTEEERVAFGEEPPEGAFPSTAVAIAWGFARGVFNDEAHARNAYEEIKRTKRPANAREMRDLWVLDVYRRLAEKEQAKPNGQPEPAGQGMLL